MRFTHGACSFERESNGKTGIVHAADMCYTYVVLLAPFHGVRCIHLVQAVPLLLLRSVAMPYSALSTEMWTLIGCFLLPARRERLFQINIHPGFEVVGIIG